MKSVLLILLASITCVSCDDIIFTDGRTLVEGYVIDDVTGDKLPNAKVLLMECQVKLLSSRCDHVLDSAYTNADGYYSFRFKDRRKTDFGVKLADFKENTVFPSSLTTTNGHIILDNDAYLVREGRENSFNFYARPFTTLLITLKLNNTGYQDAFLFAPFKYFYFQNRANEFDTTLHVKAIPEESYTITLRLTGPDKADKIVEDSIYVEKDSSSELTIEL